MCALLLKTVITDTWFQLCATLEAESGISITPQALNEDLTRVQFGCAKKESLWYNKKRSKRGTSTIIRYN